MSTEETIAMTVAQQLAPELGNGLPRAVAAQIAKARGEDSAYRSADPAQLAALASLLFTAVGLAWTVHMGEWQKAQTAAAAAQPKPDRETQKRAILERLDKDLNHIAGLDGDRRKRMLSAVVEEALQEADRQSRPSA
jgi:hypothetical protein